MLACYAKAAKKKKETFRNIGLWRSAWGADSSAFSDISYYMIVFVALTVLFLS